ncbi:MAG: Response regulator receiver protein [uncultured bacterium]|nr:MAG: Response regulator receiver protein [uncultured bacterium]
MLKILIADDSKTARMIIQRCLEMTGFSNCEYVHAANGFEALAIIRAGGIQLLITDLNMPKLDGKGLLKAVKSSPRLIDLPVIVVSSMANPALEKELHSIGASSIINKPVSPAKLLESIESIMEKGVIS